MGAPGLDPGMENRHKRKIKQTVYIYMYVCVCIIYILYIYIYICIWSVVESLVLYPCEFPSSHIVLQSRKLTLREECEECL